jgi:hypothetical protein
MDALAGGKFLVHPGIPEDDGGISGLVLKTQQAEEDLHTPQEHHGRAQGQEDRFAIGFEKGGSVCQMRILPFHEGDVQRIISFLPAHPSRPG